MNASTSCRTAAPTKRQPDPIDHPLADRELRDWQGPKDNQHRPIDVGYRRTPRAPHRRQPTHLGRPRIALKDRRLADRHWYILTVAPRAEVTAAVLLEQDGCAVLLPREADEVRWNRYHRGRRKIYRPLTRGYLFVGFTGHPNWLQVRQWPCVQGVVGVARSPLRADFDAIMQFMVSHEALEVEPPSRKRNLPYGVGDTVKVSLGPFAAFEGRVEAIKEEDAEVLIDLFGRENRVSMPLDNLRCVA